MIELGCPQDLGNMPWQISRLSLSCSHWWESAHSECYHEVILRASIATFKKTTQRHIYLLFDLSDGFSPKLTVSDDGTKILAVIGLNDFYVWEKDATEVLFSANQAGLQGTWSKVYSDAASLPGNQAKGATCDATFFVSEVSVIY